MHKVFEKEVRLGILKGGQLARMLLQPCMNYGIIPHIMDNDPEAPAQKYCQKFQLGDASSYDDVYRFGKDLDAVTLEFEHINLKALKQLRGAGVNVYPSPELVEIVQDKGRQKQFYRDHGFPTSEFWLVDNRSGVSSHFTERGLVQKKRVAGYDGRGVVVLKTAADLDQAFDEPSVLEERVSIDKEISVLVARNVSGQVATYPSVEMVVHAEANMLDYLVSPARISSDQEDEAVRLASRLAEELDLVGLLAVEMFLTSDGQLLINEIAPRPHNSGHHSIEANVTSQFEQLVRAIFDLPLGSTALLSPAAMVNIVGAEGFEGPAVYQGLERFLNMSGVYVHLYGKKYTRPYRKMGHVTVVRDNLAAAIEIIEQIKEEVKTVSCQT